MSISGPQIEQSAGFVCVLVSVRVITIKLNDF